MSSTAEYTRTPTTQRALNHYQVNARARPALEKLSKDAAHIDASVKPSPAPAQQPHRGDPGEQPAPGAPDDIQYAYAQNTAYTQDLADSDSPSHQVS